MVWAIVFMCAIAAIIGWIQTKFIFNPLTIMGVIWGIIIPFSSFGLYRTDVPSEKAYDIIFIGLLTFFIGSIIGFRRRRIVFRFKKREGNSDKNRKYELNYALLHILCIISIIYMCFQMLLVIQLLLSGNRYDLIRVLYASGDSEFKSSPIQVILQAFIASPTAYLVIALLPLEILKQKNERNKTFIIESILVVVLWVLTSGGRSIILWLGLYMVVAYLLKKKSRKFDWKHFWKKNKYLIIIAAIGLFVFLYAMTLSRKGDDVDFLREIYIYFVCPIPFFDYHMNNLDHTYAHLYGYGISSFYGLLYPILYILRLVLGTQSSYIEQIYNMSFSMLETGKNIGGEIYMNAFATVFWQPYLDGRWVGVFIILLLFGLVCSRFLYNAKYAGDDRSVLLYMLLVQKVVFSMVRFYFTQQSQAFCFIFALIIMKKVNECTSLTNDHL